VHCRKSPRPWPEQASFEILSIIGPSHAAATQKGARALVRRVESAIQQAIACLRSKCWEAERGAIGDDDPKIIIIDRARASPTDLIVVGSHSRSPLERFLLGSVAQAVQRYAPCSVEIAQAGTGRPIAVN
jgi:nucleotide-binding universal stress UspA family protein